MKLTLKEHISDKLITVGKSVSAKDAHRIMANFWVRHLPVIDEDSGEVIGLIAERDILSEPSELNSVEELLGSQELISFQLDTPVKTILNYFIEHKASACLISEDDEVIGLVTVEDMLLMLDQLLDKEESESWSLNEILLNPALQKAAYLLGQAGI